MPTNKPDPANENNQVSEQDATHMHLPELQNSADLELFSAPGQTTQDRRETVKPTEHSRTIGNYKLLQQIGSGGMGQVWMADQTQPVRRRVAIKLIKAGLDNAQVTARFEAERQALAMMDHQCIAKVFDAGATPDGLPYFVMELVQGIPITKYCDSNRLTLDERLNLFADVCSAVQHAHQKGIIHRDLKPSNILVTLYDGNPVPKVIDFGLAKALEHQTRLTDRTLFTEFGQIVGTLQYMSPEQAEMNALDVDTRTDIYSLGVLLYELLTGSTPIEADTLANQAIFKVLESIREKDPPRPSDRLSESRDAITGISSQRRIEPKKLQQLLRGDLDWIVMKSLEKDRRRRYETANGLAEDVRRFLNDQPIAARPPSRAYQFNRFVRKNRGLVASLATIFALLVLGILGTSLFAWRAGLAENQADLARESTEDLLAKSNLMLADARLKEHRVTEAKQVLHSIPEKHRKLNWFMADREINGSDITLYGHTRDVTSVQYSQDGKRIVSSSWDGTIKVWDAVTGQELLSIPFHPKSYVEAARFFSNDDKIAACGETGLIKVFDSRTGIELSSLQTDGREVGSIAISPDSKWLAADVESSIQVWDVISGRKETQFDFTPRFFTQRIQFSPNGEYLGVMGCPFSDQFDVKIKIWQCESWEALTFPEVRLAVDFAFVPTGGVFLTNKQGVTWLESSSDLTALQVGKLPISRLPSLLELSPSGCVVACVDVDDILIADARTFGQIHRLVGHGRIIRSISFSPDSQRMVSGSEDGIVKVWDLRSGSHKSAVMPEPSPFGGRTVDLYGRGLIPPMALSSDSRVLAYTNGFSEVVLRDVRDNSIVRRLLAHETEITAVGFSINAELLATGGADGSIAIVESSTGKVIWQLYGHSSRVSDVSFNVHSTELASTSLDGTIRVWNLETGNEKLVRFVGPGNVNAVRYHKTGKSLLLLSADKLEELDTAGSEYLRRTLMDDLENGSASAMCMVVSNTKNTVGVASFNQNRIQFGGRESKGFDLEEREVVTSLCLIDNESQLMSVSYEGLKIWDLDSGNELARYPLKVEASSRSAALVSGDSDLVAIKMQMDTKGVSHQLELWHCPRKAEIQDHSVLEQGNERKYRAAKARLDPTWQTQQGEKALVWWNDSHEPLSLHAAVFHFAQALIASPDNMIAFEKFHHSLTLWKTLVTERPDLGDSSERLLKLISQASAIPKGTALDSYQSYETIDRPATDETRKIAEERYPFQCAMYFSRKAEFEDCTRILEPIYASGKIGVGSLRLLAHAYAELGRYDDAGKAFAQLCKRENDSNPEDNLAFLRIALKTSNELYLKQALGLLPKTTRQLRFDDTAKNLGRMMLSLPKPVIEDIGKSVKDWESWKHHYSYQQPVNWLYPLTKTLAGEPTMSKKCPAKDFDPWRFYYLALSKAQAREFEEASKLADESRKALLTGSSKQHFAEQYDWEMKLDIENLLAALDKQWPSTNRVLADESFKYSTGTIVGQNSGRGWGAPWGIKASQGSATVIDKGLTYDGLNCSGGALELTASPQKEDRMDLVRKLEQIAGVPTSSLWVAFLFRSVQKGEGDLFLGFGENRLLDFGNSWGNEFGINVNHSTIAPSNGETHLLVYKISFDLPKSRAWLWVDPKLDRPPVDSEANASRSESFVQADTLRLTLQGYGNGKYIVDELRVGPTFESVVPRDKPPEFPPAIQ